MGLLNLNLLVFTLLLGSCALQKPNTDARRHDVYIAGFFPFGKGVENSETGRGVMPSVKLALDHVNEHSSILRNYRINMWWNDTMISRNDYDIALLNNDIIKLCNKFVLKV